MAVTFQQRFRARLLACPMRVRQLACGIQLVVIAILSLVPSWLFPPSPVQMPGLDKLVHVAMYGVLGALLRWMAGRGEGEIPPASRWLPLAAAGYGLLMEFLQFALCGGSRMFSWADAAANLAGAVLFWLGAGWLLKARES